MIKNGKLSLTVLRQKKASLISLDVRWSLAVDLK